MLHNCYNINEREKIMKEQEVYNQMSQDDKDARIRGIIYNVTKLSAYRMTDDVVYTVVPHMTVASMTTQQAVWVKRWLQEQRREGGSGS